MKDITSLTVAISHPDRSEADKLREICLTIRDVVPNANRISLWLFNEQFDAISCLICLDEKGQYSRDQVLNKQDFGEYFEFIMTNQVLNASQARSHPATSCFNRGYFDLFNIHSLLDYIFHNKFKPAGVICCERVGNAVDWTDKDIEFLKRLSNVTSMFLNSDEIARTHSDNR